jgi:hypothetical protein
MARRHERVGSAADEITCRRHLMSERQSSPVNATMLLPGSRAQPGLPVVGRLFLGGEKHTTNAEKIRGQAKAAAALAPAGPAVYPLTAAYG